MFAPPRVVAATSPPLNAPRETSYVLVTTRVVRNPSCGTELVLMFRPSSVTALASERSPATENAAAVESVAPMPMTPGTRVASRFRVGILERQPRHELRSERAFGRAGRGDVG